MSTLQEDIIVYLQAKDLVQGYGIDSFSDYVPNEPDNVVIMYEYEGSPISPFTEEVHRSIQVMVRCNIAEEAKEKANAIFKVIKTDNTTVWFTPERFAQVHLRQSPFKLKTDENNRVIYCFNIGVSTTLE